MTKQEFIETAAKAVKKYAPQYGILVYSPIIAQAILESGWGSSKLASKYHNYFGLKAGPSWKEKAVNLKTQEEYTPGTLTTITDAFRVFDSLDEGVKGYFEFIQYPRYKNLRGITDPQKYLETITADGYATSSTYAAENMALVRQYGLTQYDRKGSEATMEKVEKAVQWMEATARDSRHGYDQRYRWGEKGDYDCSAAVITAYENAGIPVKSSGATYTGNMLGVFKKCGFIDVTNKVNLNTGAGLIRGDVLLNTIHHTALYCGNGLEVEASINEKGTATGGQPGDQTGREFFIRSYRNYPWTHVLRYPEGSGGSAGITVEEAARNAIKGLYGNGEDRKNAIAALGLDYNTVQARVNAILKGESTEAPARKSVDELAKEVLRGSWGNGSDRKNRLTAAGYDYAAVQARVNELTGGASSSRLSVGDRVKVTNAVTYDGYKFKCWYDTYTVMQVSGNRVVIGVNGVVTAAVNISNLKRV